MQRIPEPELMLDIEQVKGWDSAGRDISVYNFLYWVKFLKLTTGFVLEIGCGTGTHIIALAKEYPDIQFVGIDGSPVMIDIAKQKVIEEGLEDRISLVCTRIEDYTPDQKFDAILSYGTLHHVTDQRTFWKHIEDINTKSAPVLVIDILRPETQEQLEHYMLSARDQNKFYKEDLYNSFRAAYTTDEIFETLNNLNISYQHYEGIHPERGNVIIILLNTSLAL